MQYNKRYTAIRINSFTNPKTEQVDVELDYVSATSSIYLSALDQADIAATVPAGTLSVNATISFAFINRKLRTNTAKQIRFRATNTGCRYKISTNGWVDTRGK